MGDDSGTGVAFTRSPTTGEKAFFGEFLTNAQGEDVVAGIRTPLAIAEMARTWPRLYRELAVVFHTLEQHYKEMQDVEFTVENQRLYMLQTRTGKRTAAAALRIAVEMEGEGLMSRNEALLAVDPAQIDQLLHKQLDPTSKEAARVVATGLPASPGGAVGMAVFSAEQAVSYKAAGKPAVLIRLETSPEDIKGMDACVGILTARGGMTSHAAVVARGMGRCCVVGCEAVAFEGKHSDTIKTCMVGALAVNEGDWLTLDGATGEVMAGKVRMTEAVMSGYYATIMAWADAARELEIKTNADTPKDAQTALGFGAEGIGVVRTEHMFFNGDRIDAVRQMILSDTDEARARALATLLPYQRADFEGIFEVMDNKPVTIRLLDPPFHEFFPHTAKEIEPVAQLLGESVTVVQAKIAALQESNPMLGFRGCRIALLYPQVPEMQVRAVFEAALACNRRGITVTPEIEVPLVGNLKEFLPLKAIVRRVAKETGAEGVIRYTIGTMVEVPRICLTADEIAGEVDFMSFGTNDLTSLTTGISRDDAGKFVPEYVRMGIYDRDPYATIDQGGVGKLMQICVGLARSVKPGLDIGICGEHGGDPQSVMFCHRIGLTNVSCSPFRVPIARLAAAHAAILYGPRPSLELPAIVMPGL
jgi:pyruvate,orthophosphate dikinase